MPITKKTSAGTIIKDFVQSDNPKFAGKSEEERKRMALGAYYSKHPEKSNKSQNESVAEFINQVGSDKDLAAAAIQSALMDKVAERLEILKADIAQKQFGLSEAFGKDDDGDDGDESDDGSDKKGGKFPFKKGAKDDGKDTDKDGDEDADQDQDGDEDGTDGEDGNPAQKPITGKGDKPEVKEDAYQVTDPTKDAAKHKQASSTDKKPLKPTFKPSVK